jgi:hypothetical protein
MNEAYSAPNIGPERIRLARQLSNRVDAARREAAAACRHGLATAAAVRPLLARLEEIGRELDRLERPDSPWPAQQAHPFWRELPGDAKGR